MPFDAPAQPLWRWVIVTLAVLLPACQEAAAPPAAGVRPPVRSVSVTPDSATISTGGAVQLSATPLDSAGKPLSGRAVTWSTSAASVAMVSGTGLVTGLGIGSATVTATSEGKSGAAAITVTAPTAVSCLGQAGPTITLSGVYPSPYENTSLANGTKIDASTAQFITGTTIPVHIGGSGICYHGGEIMGQWPPSTPWTFMYTTYGLLVSGPNGAVENVRIFNYGNGVSFDQAAPNWRVRSSYFGYGRDGCIENDFDWGGTVDDVFLDCYLPFASEEYVSGVDGSNNVETIMNTLVHLQPMDGVYSGPVPGSDGIFVWGPKGPQLALFNNIFKVDQNSNEPYLAPPPGKLVACANNVMIWLGAGPFPDSLPTTFNGQPCFTLMTGQAGLDYWNNAVARWKATHPKTLPDIAAPVVSLFSPGSVGSTTLTGTVTLTASAADDPGVAGVQFQLSGQNIGAEVTTDSPSTKFSLSWDSHGAANGTYTLTATARDSAGNTTTSAPVTVTISN